MAQRKVELMTISTVVKLLNSIMKEVGDIPVVQVTTPTGLPHDHMEFFGVMNVTLSEDPRKDTPSPYKNLAVIVTKEGNSFTSGKLYGVVTSVPKS